MLDFACHHGYSVLPARAYHPQDKAKVESTVQIVERWILARLRQQSFHGVTGEERNALYEMAKVKGEQVSVWSDERPDDDFLFALCTINKNGYAHGDLASHLNHTNFANFINTDKGYVAIDTDAPMRTTYAVLQANFEQEPYTKKAFSLEMSGSWFLTRGSCPSGQRRKFWRKGA